MLQGKNRARTTHLASFGPIGTCLNVFIFFLFLFSTTTTPSAYPTPSLANASRGWAFSLLGPDPTLLAHMHEPRVGSPSPTIADPQQPTQAHEGPPLTSPPGRERSLPRFYASPLALSYLC